MFFREPFRLHNKMGLMCLVLCCNIFGNASTISLDSIFKASTDYNIRYIDAPKEYFYITPLDEFLKTKDHYELNTPFRFNQLNDTIYIIETINSINCNYSIDIKSSVMRMTGGTACGDKSLKLHRIQNRNSGIEAYWIETWQTDSLKKYGVRYPPYIKSSTDYSYRVVSRVIIKNGRLSVVGISYWPMLIDEYIPTKSPYRD